MTRVTNTRETYASLEHLSHACSTLKSHMSQRWPMANVLYLSIAQLFSKCQYLDINAPIIEPVTFDDGDPLEWPSTIIVDVALRLDELNERGQHSDDFENRSKRISYEILLPYFVFSIGILIYHLI
jgi:hypothetical protein